MEFEKFPDWAERLNRFVVEESRRVTPGMTVDWGKNDCCTFMANGVIAMTGIDPMARFRGRYSTELGSRRALKKYGKGTLAATLEDIFLEKVTPGFASQGDVALLGYTCGLVLGRKCVFLGNGGLVFVPTVSLEGAFRV